MKEELSKKQQVIYCTLVVIVLIFLAFGDKIVLHYIPKRANPNQAIFGETADDIKDTNYQIPFLIKLDIQEVNEKIKNKEDFFLLSSRSNCVTCEKLLPIIKSFKETNQIKKPIYYIDRDLYNMTNLEFKTFVNHDLRIQENIDFTPYLMEFTKGRLLNQLVGYPKREVLEEFFCQND